MTQMVFFSEKACAGVFGQIVAENDFLKFYNKLTSFSDFFMIV